MMRKQTLFLILTTAIFGVIYALISLANHYYFRTYAFDLGLYTNALYKYAHFQLADSLMIKENYEHMLGGHFDLYLLIFSPLVYIFGTYTLLIIQIAAIVAGGIGVYRYFAIDNKNHSVGMVAMLFYFSFYGIFSALSFDYHSNVVAASLVPWLFYFIKKRKYRISLLFLGLILISQENISLWVVFICLGLLIEYRKDKKAVIFLSILTGISIIYFISVINFIIPAFSHNKEYSGFTYSVLGDTPGEALKGLFMHPIDNIKALFTNHTHHPGGDYLKLEMWVLVFISGLYLLFLRPSFLVMLIPVFFQKLFHDNDLVWGIDGQYSIEFAPILAIGAFSVISDMKNRNTARIIALVALAGVMLSTFRVMDNTVMHTNKSRIRFYAANHYKRNYDVKSVHHQLKLIPGGADVSALTPFVPQLSLRNRIYQFPIISDAEYIVYSEKEGKYPLDEEKFAQKIYQILASGEWEILYEDDGFVVLKKLDSSLRSE